MHSIKTSGEQDPKASFLPDLFIIDGGLKQLDVLTKLFQQ